MFRVAVINLAGAISMHMIISLWINFDLLIAPVEGSGNCFHVYNKIEVYRLFVIITAANRNHLRQNGDNTRSIVCPLSLFVVKNKTKKLRFIQYTEDFKSKYQYTDFSRQIQILWNYEMMLRNFRITCLVFRHQIASIVWFKQFPTDLWISYSETVRSGVTQAGLGRVH